MKRGNILGVALGLGLVTFAGLASAQERTEPAAAPAATEGHASGLMLQGRMQTQGGLLSLGGSGFVFGYQGPSYAVGLGLGLTRVGLSAAGDASGSGLLFQIQPTALIDVWKSSDGRARANVIAGVGYGRASLTVNSPNENCTIDGLGNETCTTTFEENTASAGFVPVMIGFGGDYFLSRNFALGAEVGLQAAFTTGLEAKQGSVSNSIDASANMQLAYGALRATFVLGD
jgi:hypothetical protein